MKMLVVLAAVVILVAAAVLLLVWDMRGSSPAICSCGSGGGWAWKEYAPEEADAMVRYIRSPEFILAILRRDPKYVELIPEAGSFWRPFVQPGTVRNDQWTNFDHTYQPLFTELRDDIYVELGYRHAMMLLKVDSMVAMRKALVNLDDVKNQRPSWDIHALLEQALHDAPSDFSRNLLMKILEASRKGESLEVAFRRETRG